MGLYSGIDLHSNNLVLVVIDQEDRVVYQKRLPNDIKTVLSKLTPFHAELCGIAVESTFNWYWLVDGLMEAGYPLHLVNTSAVKQYDGLKYTDDDHDAFWLAHLLRLGILPTGYIYPKQQRAIRDLARKRIRLVQQRTSFILRRFRIFRFIALNCWASFHSAHIWTPPDLQTKLCKKIGSATIYSAYW